MRAYLTILLVVTNLSMLFAQNQTSQTFFGRNRVQYKTFDWQYYNTDNFDVYFNTGGRELAVFIGRRGNEYIKQMEDLLNYRVNGRYQFIVYNKLSDLNQTNTGLDLQMYNTGGLTKISGNKVLLHFDGNRQGLIEQLKLGLTRALVSDLIYGGNIQDRVQSTTLINLPDWYLNGLLEYCSKGWNYSLEDQLRPYFVYNKIKNFNVFQFSNSSLAGHSFWNFIANTYGKNTISNIVYMTRVNRSVDESFSHVIDKNLKQLSSEWFKYYTNKYNNEKIGSSQSNLLNASVLIAKKKKLHGMKLSPSGKFLAYTEEKDGVSTLKLRDLNSTKTYSLVKIGKKYNDVLGSSNYPVFDFHPNSRLILAFYERKGILYMAQIRIDDLNKKPEIQESVFTRVEQVSSLSFSPDGQNVALSASRQGQSDIFLFHLPSKRVTPITLDAFDDYEACFVKKGTLNIMFSSTRSIDTLVPNLIDTIPHQALPDLFIWNASNKQAVKRITDTPTEAERNPLRFSDSSFSFLSSNTGVFNIVYGKIDSISYFMDTVKYWKDTVILQRQSDFRFSLEKVSASSVGTFCYYFPGKKKQEIRIESLRPPVMAYKSGQGGTLYQAYLNGQTNTYNEPRIQAQEMIAYKPDTTVKDTIAQNIAMDSIARADGFRYLFQVDTDLSLPIDEKGKAPNLDKSLDFAQAKDLKDPFRFSKAKFYDPIFGIDYLVTQASGAISQPNIPNFTISSLNNLRNRPGLALLGGSSDIFENYKLSAGIFLGSTLRDNQYFLMFEDLKKRLDKRIVFTQQRQTQQASQNTIIRINTIEFLGQIVYPFNQNEAIKVSGIFRKDIQNVLATDVNRLLAPATQVDWGGIRTEYVFDNTKVIIPNILKGQRYKIYAEIFNNFSQKGRSTGVFGIDYRKYIPLHKQLIWANRFNFSASFGSVKINNLLGGVDNWLLARQANEYSFNLQNLSNSVLATNMRGFKQNIRNGSNAMVINSEVRWPIISYLFNRPISSNMLRTLQLISFFDVGSAWSDINPYDPKNPLNTQVYQNGPVKVTVFTNKQPLLFGYGFGVRTQLFGYFLRIDRGWGIENGLVNNPITYFSLSTDF